MKHMKQKQNVKPIYNVYGPSITNILWSDSNITMPMMALNSNVKLDNAKCYIKATNFFVDPAMIKVSMYLDICTSVVYFFYNICFVSICIVFLGLKVWKLFMDDSKI